MDTQTTKLGDELLEAKKALQNNAQAIKEEESRKNNLDTRHAELTGNFGGLEKAVQECLRRKDEIFEKELTGQAGDGEVGLVKKALALAESELSDCKDRIAALDRMRNKESNHLQKLREGTAVLERKFWRALYEKLKLEIIDKVGDLVNRAHIAKMFSGGGDRPSSLADIFGPARLEENNKMRTALRKEHFGED